MASMGDVMYRFTSRSVDNFVFRLCYRWTVVLLIVFSFIITCRLAYGTSMSCSSRDDLTAYEMNSHCYFDKMKINDIDFRYYNDGAKLGDDKLVTYYPWVNLTFLVMAFVFYLPRLLWRSFESGYIGRLTSGLAIPLGKEQKRSQEILCLAKYIQQTKNRHRLFAYVFIFFEACNFAISVFQIFWLIHFFDIRAPTDANLLNNPDAYRHYYFPTKAKCTMLKYGRSGDISRFSIACDLPLNFLFVKMFYILYAWFMLLAVCTGLALVFRVAMVAKFSRKKVLQWVMPPEHKSNALSISGQLSYTDWFILTAIKKCILDTDFNKLVEKILVLMQNKGKDLSFEKKDGDQYSENEDSDIELQNSSGTTPLNSNYQQYFFSLI